SSTADIHKTRKPIDRYRAIWYKEAVSHQQSEEYSSAISKKVSVSGPAEGFRRLKETDSQY
ncbi:MAG: hypothetical protein OXD49_21145, partial [Candidatus Poribacteria bacterium]|nr:hypothetical protein [Candidatus Poribacteria bacterium]